MGISASCLRPCRTPPLTITASTQNNWHSCRSLIHEPLRIGPPATFQPLQSDAPAVDNDKFPATDTAPVIDLIYCRRRLHGHLVVVASGTVAPRMALPHQTQEKPQQTSSSISSALINQLRFICLLTVVSADNNNFDGWVSLTLVPIHSKPHANTARLQRLRFPQRTAGFSVPPQLGLPQPRQLVSLVPGMTLQF